MLAFPVFLASLANIRPSMKTSCHCVHVPAADSFLGVYLIVRVALIDWLFIIKI